MSAGTRNYMASVMADDESCLIEVDVRDLPEWRQEELLAEARDAGDTDMVETLNGVLAGLIP